MYQGPDRRQSSPPRLSASKFFGYAALFACGVCFGVLFFYGVTG